MPLRRLAAALLCAAPAAALAQPSSADHPFSVGVLAGGTLPSGELSRAAYDPGFHVGALAQYQPASVRWLAVRVDGSYRRLGGGTQDVTDENGAVVGRLTMATSIVSAGASVVVRVPGLRSAVQPYALAGVAAYRLRPHLTSSDGASFVFPDSPVVRNYGNTFGLGLDAPVGRASAFAEARYERVGDNLRLVPLSLGVRIR
jgi:hypothetical protein